MQTQTQDRINSPEANASDKPVAVDAQVEQGQGSKAQLGELQTPSVEALSAQAEKYAVSSLDTVVSATPTADAPVQPVQAAPAEQEVAPQIGHVEIAQHLGVHLRVLRNALLESVNDSE